MQKQLKKYNVRISLETWIPVAAYHEEDAETSVIGLVEELLGDITSEEIAIQETEVEPENILEAIAPLALRAAMEYGIPTRKFVEYWEAGKFNANCLNGKLLDELVEYPTESCNVLALMIEDSKGEKRPFFLQNL